MLCVQLEKAVENRGAPARVRTDDRPDPKQVRGKCPKCGGVLVSNCRYIQGKGYLIAWECWESLRDEPTCTYRRVL